MKIHINIYDILFKELSPEYFTQKLLCHTFCGCARTIYSQKNLLGFVYLQKGGGSLDVILKVDTCRMVDKLVDIGPMDTGWKRLK